MFKNFEDRFENCNFSFEDFLRIFDAAKNALEFSYSPYSEFKVGAAILCEDKKIFCGCNIENASFSAGCCAERTAIFKAISEGQKKFRAICIVAKKTNAKNLAWASPCGICRQVMSEFCPADFKIILAKSTENFKIFTLGELFPESFSAQNIE